MRASALVLLLTQDERLVQAARLEIYAQSSLELVVARTLDEGQGLLANGRLCAVVVHLDAGVTDEQVSQLLWTASIAPRGVPVVALSDRYDALRARTLFELGVVDCLDRVEHLGKLAGLLTTLVPKACAVQDTDEEADSRAGLPANPRLAQGPPVPATLPLPGLQRFPIVGEG